MIIAAGGIGWGDNGGHCGGGVWELGWEIRAELYSYLYGYNWLSSLNSLDKSEWVGWGLCWRSWGGRGEVDMAGVGEGGGVGGASKNDGRNL